MLVDLTKYVESLPVTLPVSELHQLIDGFLSRYDYK